MDLLLKLLCSARNELHLVTGLRGNNVIMRSRRSTKITSSNLITDSRERHTPILLIMVYRTYLGGK